MAMNGGSVTIADDGTASGAGLALALYNDLLACPSYTTIPSGASGAAAKRQLAELCGVIGPAVVSHITTNAVVTTTIGTGDSGLQRVGGNPTDAPSASKTLGGTVA